MRRAAKRKARVKAVAAEAGAVDALAEARTRMYVTEPAPAEEARDMLELQKELGLNMHSAEPNHIAVQENAEALDAGLARLQAVFPSVEGAEKDDYMSHG